MIIKKVLIGLAASAVFASAFALNRPVQSAEVRADVSEPLTYRWTNSNNWDRVYMYAFNSDSDKNAEWPGIELSAYYTNDYSQKVYVGWPEKAYSTIIFNNNNGQQTVDITVNNNVAWWGTGYWNEGKMEVSGTSSIDKNTYHFYDYNSRFDGKAHAEVSGFGNSFDFDMTASATYDGGQNRIYDFQIDRIYDGKNIVFSQSDDATDKTTSITIGAKNYCYILSDGDVVGGDAWWDNINYVSAHDWSMNYLHLRDIDHSDEGTKISTPNCETYYNVAKTAYQKLYSLEYSGNHFISTQIHDNFGSAAERFSYWAAANGDSFDKDSMILSSSAGGVKGSWEISHQDALVLPILITAGLAAVLTTFLVVSKVKHSKD